jgi:SdrD B-like domain
LNARLAQQFSDSKRGASEKTSTGPEPVQRLGKSAFVYVDRNNNGEPDVNEQTLAAITVGVRHPDGHLVIVRTDLNGQFSFAELPDGTYALTVVEGLPAEFSISPNWANKTITVAGQLILEDVGFPVTTRSEPDQLALTGSSSDLTSVVGCLTLVSGLIAMFGARRRKTPSSRAWAAGLHVTRR